MFVSLVILWYGTDCRCHVVWDEKGGVTQVTDKEESQFQWPTTVQNTNTMSWI